MKRESKTIWSIARRDFRNRADEYFYAVTDNDRDASYRQRYALHLAKAALRLHMLEQGRRT